MGIPESNINNTGSLTKFLEKVKSAGVPDRVTMEFLKTLGFKSSNDRPIIAVLRGIGFLDANGTPTARYKAFRGPDGPTVLAGALREAYADLFLANVNAHTAPLEELKGIVAARTGKAEAPATRIARTFLALSKSADFEAEPVTDDAEEREDEGTADGRRPRERSAPVVPPLKTPGGHAFHYNIQIHLPTTTDVGVYNAIFRSLREHLL